MRWMMLGLIPLLICGVMCFGGVILAALGLRHLSERSRDVPPTSGTDDREDIRNWV
jgi:hypothetical protein